MQIEEFDVNSFLKDILEGENKVANEKGIKLIFDDKAPKSIVSADKTYFALIFENLLSNAIKFSPRDTEVILQTSINDSNLQIRVMDYGPGIAADEQDRLFQKFSKLSTRPTAGESSTGLGLSLVKRYSELVKASVWYEPSDEYGAVFVVEFKPVDR